jgi:DNA (cytosine-5)-methyltransferase 1
MSAYYNEIDQYCAEWIRRLMAAGLVPAGEVDTRSIKEVTADDVRSFTQCHFFAGLGGWAFACRLAGWPDDRALWTGSCPCQPFSSAGKRKGAADPRHLWPDFYRLIRGGRPARIVGEQVAGAPGYAWLDGVQADLEAEDYPCRAVDIPACSVNAPHIRNRLYWLAYAQKQSERESNNQISAEPREGGSWLDSSGPEPRHSAISSIPNASLPRLSVRQGEPRQTQAIAERQCEDAVRLEHADGAERRPDAQGRNDVDDGTDAGRREAAGGFELASAGRPGFWDDWELIGPDPAGKYRRLKSGIRLLVNELPARVPKLRALGNAISPELAAEVLRAWMEVAP